VRGESPVDGGLAGWIIAVIVIGALLLLASIIGGVVFAMRGKKDDDQSAKTAEAPPAGNLLLTHQSIRETSTYFIVTATELKDQSTAAADPVDSNRPVITYIGN
jgi:hypothetical protein